MATEKQREAARRNIKKAQAVWRAMSHEEHARAQPQGRGRKKPGTTGEGEYYRITVRPKEEFVTFRTQDVGEPGHVQRLAGKRGSGSWDTQAWLISKHDAHVERETHVLHRIERREEVVGLEDEADVLAAYVGQRFRAEVRRIRTGDADAARRRRQNAAEDGEQRRLA